MGRMSRQGKPTAQFSSPAKQAFSWPYHHRHSITPSRQQ
jgi:hypothetical protein